MLKPGASSSRNRVSVPFQTGCQFLAVLGPGSSPNRVLVPHKVGSQLSYYCSLFWYASVWDTKGDLEAPELEKQAGRMVLFGEVIMFATMVSLYLLAFCRVVIGLTFMVSSVGKVLNIAQFRQTICNFRILPGWLSGVAAMLFMCGEVAVVVFVVIGGSLLVVGFSLAIFLLLLFCIALLSVLVRRIRTTCNCFGASAKQVSHLDVWRNAGFILFALGGYGSLAEAKGTQVNLSLLGWGLIGLGAVVFVIIWIQLGEIIQLFRPG